MSSDFENGEFLAFLEEEQCYLLGELSSPLLADPDRAALEQELSTVLAAIETFES